MTVQRTVFVQGIEGMAGSKDEVFWGDLLDRIRDRKLLPVVGPDLCVVDVAGTEQTLTTLIGQRLVERFGLTVPPGPTTMSEAVEAFLRERGMADVETYLYSEINRIISDLAPIPGKALRDLAAIRDLTLFVSTTPDNVLARALNEVRFQGRPETHEVAFSPSRSTDQQLIGVAEPVPTDTVVFSLFGQADVTSVYAIHDEDQLEYIHELISMPGILPGWLWSQLWEDHLLFLGCHIEDWLGRLLLRLESHHRLSAERKQFFFVHSAPFSEPSLSDFLSTYLSKTQVRVLEMDPTAFVAELCRRWEEQNANRPRVDVIHSSSAPVTKTPTIFVSYLREDGTAAQRLAQTISSVGGDVWFDKQRLKPGDHWDSEILNAIARTVTLFIAVMSARTERETEGYVFQEWREAAKRSQKIVGRSFIIPVIIDEDYNGDATRYKHGQEALGDGLQYGWAPAGEPDRQLLALLQEEIRKMRRPGAAT